MATVLTVSDDHLVIGLSTVEAMKLFRKGSK